MTTTTHPPRAGERTRPRADRRAAHRERQASADATFTAEFGQYRLRQILAIWAAAALPMGAMLWFVMPVLVVPRADFPGLVYLLLATGGLVWQGVVAFVVLRHEVRPFTWAALRRRLWLHRPTSPRTGRGSWWLLAWTFPVALALLAYDDLEPLRPLQDAFLRLFPALEAPEHALIENLADPRTVGQWWLLGVLAVLLVFNYLLGEELIFRGILLPKMRGVFGRWDVVANGVLFATYHLHLIWTLPLTLARDWVYAALMRRYRSSWMSTLLHAYDGVFLAVLFPLVIAGVVTS
ncbi:CPBP family intramembrane glutamic endopeptidase [Cellulomonas composti]|uniref:CAAX prenyl protease 2/Lysostaphin resistance protein A-like domain-containing protein n=1 Tax=Cellulomonas composti TaxID=266130 RepID=A0A511JAG0_9CELL|nr:CPBP family intramembrane glutamic endopeptidase [Cellulomonas composti]GEL94985.1 hypothetical protein CCO02nite_16430 [Cellulomonas composti]